MFARGRDFIHANGRGRRRGLDEREVRHASVVSADDGGGVELGRVRGIVETGNADGGRTKGKTQQRFHVVALLRQSKRQSKVLDDEKEE